MAKLNRTRSFLRVVAGAALLSLTACQGSADGPIERDASFHTEDGNFNAVKATTAAEEAFLGDVWSVRETVVDVSETVVRVFEVAPVGGDPAANGTGVMVSVSNWRGGEQVFETGLDVEAVTAVHSNTFEGTARVTIDVSVTGYDEALGQLTSEQNSYLFEFADSAESVPVAAELYDTNLLPDAEARTDLAASVEPSHALLPSVASVRQLETADVTVRVYEVMPPGDPAMNGTYVFTNLSSWDGQSHTFDTGIDVRNVYDIMFRNGELEVHSIADVMLSDGDVGTGPVVYPVRFALEGEELPSEIRVDLNPPLG
jgi:hypothetical protein